MQELSNTNQEYYFNNSEINNKIQQVKNSGVKLNIRFVNEEDYVWQLHNSTGNFEYIKAFYEFANQKGYDASPEFLGLNGKKQILKSELELYAMLGLQYVPPELRETADAIIAAQKFQIPTLIEPKDMLGMLHIHTDWSDGKDTIRTMALKSKDLGFQYVAICDHSAYAAYANGLSYPRILQQAAEIDELNAEGLGIKILKGIESDILPNGDLDYTPEILGMFDIVVASIHSNFRMNKADMTRRIIKAASNPLTTIIGHPTGRLLKTRAGYEIDIDEFTKVCAEFGKVIEINANPYRLDLPWEHAIKAKELGIKFAINPDSHRADTLSDVFIGVKAARKAWLTKDDVINTLTLEEFESKYIIRNN